MIELWILALLVPSAYFGIGVVVGIFIVIKNITRFHGAGFQWVRMAKTVGAVALVWPVMLVHG